MECRRSFQKAANVAKPSILPDRYQQRVQFLASHVSNSQKHSVHRSFRSGLSLFGLSFLGLSLLGLRLLGLNPFGSGSFGTGPFVPGSFWPTLFGSLLFWPAPFGSVPFRSAPFGFVHQPCRLDDSLHGLLCSKQIYHI